VKMAVSQVPELRPRLCASDGALAFNHIGLTPPEEGVILVNLSFKAIAFDAGAAALLKQHGQHRGKQEPGFHIPEEILSLFRNRKNGIGSCERTSLRLGAHQYICRTYTMESQNQPMFLLHLQKDTAAADAVYRIAEEYDLTDREQQALLGLAQGLTSKEVAAEMGISPNTVKAYVRLIMIKMGVTRRAAIVGKLLEYSGGVNHTLHAQNGTA
jgi:DNA-binding CsgD family transcriptional regulator